MLRKNNRLNQKPGSHLRDMKNILLILTLFSVLGLFDSCGIFDTRTPQSPTNTRSTYIPPTTPDIVLQNLVSSISEKNSANYVKCLYPGFYQYVPDSKSLANYGVIFANWNINSEKFYLDNLIAQSDQNASSNLFLSQTVTSQLSSDSAVTTSDYIIVFQHNRANIPKSAVGNFRITMRTDANSYFYITKWEDFRNNDTDFTWSALKANFSN